jgi:hypothetical protein
MSFLASVSSGGSFCPNTSYPISYRLNFNEDCSGVTFSLPSGSDSCGNRVSLFSNTFYKQTVSFVVSFVCLGFSFCFLFEFYFFFIEHYFRILPLLVYLSETFMKYQEVG